MKKIKLGLLSIGLLGGNMPAFADCASSNPKGPQAIIECIATEQNMTAENYWNNILFSTGSMDKFCQKTATENGLTTTAQQQMYNNACAYEKGSYFSYDKFIAADQEMATLAASKGYDYSFMRSNSYETNLKEFANFLATLAQETTGLLPGVTQNKNDGLYFRYENGALASCYNVPANPGVTSQSFTIGTDCTNKGLDTFITTYFPISTFTVAADSSTIATAKTYSGYYFDNDAEYVLANSPITVAFPGGVPVIISSIYPTFSTLATPPVIGWASWKGPLEPLPVYTSWQFMNSMLEPGYWIGMGNLQLTGNSMMGFFGWYHQNALGLDGSNLQTFVENYLKDGKLAWMGGLWYWNFRINGNNLPTLHKVISQSSLPECHDIAIATYMVNGGCNNYLGTGAVPEEGGHLGYYSYFMDQLGLGLKAVPYTYDSTNSNSLNCDTRVPGDSLKYLIGERCVTNGQYN